MSQHEYIQYKYKISAYSRNVVPAVFSICKKKNGFFTVGVY